VLDPAAAGGNKNAKAMFGKDELAAILRCAVSCSDSDTACINNNRWQVCAAAIHM
jgi:hypothetical protein